MKRIILGLALLLLTACGSGGDYDDNTYTNAACVDTTTNTVLDNDACSPDYGPPLGYHSWAYSSYPYDTPMIPVAYVGAPIQHNVYTFERPRRVPVTHISAPAPYRAAGDTSVALMKPTQSFLTDKRMAKARTSKPELVEKAKRQEETRRNPGIQRGGFGVTTAKTSTVPPPVRNLDSPAPGRVMTPPKVSPPAPKAAPAYKAPPPAYKAPVKTGK